jgi:hypothetical protein
MQKKQAQRRVLEQKKRKSEQYCAWLFNSRGGTITNLGRTARNCVTGIGGLQRVRFS